MEFKDKLKQLRKEKGLTQQQLADAIFVSRSTVAKWENGLGLPSPDSMSALEQFLGALEGEIATTDPETVIVSKNVKLRRICTVLYALAMVVVVILSFVFPMAILSGDYGLFPEMLTGPFSDAPYIDTGDYRFYYHVFEGDWDDGRHWHVMSTYKPIHKHFWGYTIAYEEAEAGVMLYNNYYAGKLYSYKGRDGYYNVLTCAYGKNVPDALVTLETVRIKGEDYPVQYGFFFVTPEPVESFFVGEYFINVE